MSQDGSQPRYVSTFRMHIKPPCTSLAQRDRSRTTGTRLENGIHSVLDKGSGCSPSLKGLEPPVFTEPIEDCSVDEGSDITLCGVIEGSQPIKVSWLHNGEVFHFGKPAFDGRKAMLVVRDCLPEDAGAYTCLAENRAGKTSCCAAVFVRDFETISGLQNLKGNTTSPLSKKILKNGGSVFSLAPIDEVRIPKRSGPPSTPESQSPTGRPREVIPKRRASSGTAPAVRFESIPHQREVKAGETVRLTFLFSGTSPVVSCWLRHKKQIVDGSEVWTEHSDQGSTLVIAKVQPEDRGHYTIVVKDRHGSAQHTLALSVIERPEPPASCPVVSRVSAGRLVLSWSGPCYDGGSAVLGYVVEVRSGGAAEDRRAWRELTDCCRDTSYQLCPELLPETQLRFRVRAYNAVGASEPSPESAAVRMERDDKPTEESPPTYTDVIIDSTHKVTDHYNILEKLGVGKFGQVFKLVHKETGQVCAGKFYKGRRAKEREAARKEIEIMNHLHHLKLVQCLAAYDNKPEMVMVMEFIAGGELFERICDDSFEHTEPASARYMQQILEGVSYMHQQSILHLDLKPENIVCVDQTGTSIKIIDFGLASKFDPKIPLKVMQGTPEFVAPEVINFEPVSLATDMWSVGVICYILLSGESPFQGSSDTETLALVTAAQWDFDEESFEEITEQAKDFISSLLNKDTRRRMSCEEAQAHTWMVAFDSQAPGTTKCLSKEKMKKFLARQKWKKAGKAMLALKRMALLSKGDGSPASPAEDSVLLPETQQALHSLELRMLRAPAFSQSLKDQTVTVGSSAHLSCHLTGYPDPEVVWLCGEEPVLDSGRAQIDYEEDGRCTLFLTTVGLEDANVYTCRATNDQGEALCSAKLIVKE